MGKQNLIKSKNRVRNLGEVFTPPELVCEMLDTLPENVWENDKTFFEPTCGTGNFIVEILKRKLRKGHNPLSALSTIYAMDIMEDNIKESKKRMLEIITKHINEDDYEKAKQIIDRNIIVYDTLKFDSSQGWPEI